MAKLEITQEQLDAKIKDAVAAAVKAVSAQLQQRPPSGPDEQWAAEISERRGLAKPPIPFEDFACKSPDTGSTFTARVVRGVVIDLIDYKFPDGIARHEDDSPPGLVPHGKEIKDSNGRETPDYKQWMWTEFRQADLRKFIGKKLPKYAHADADDKAAE